MASHMKKLFHRKKDDEAEEPKARPRAANDAVRDPTIRTSLYESTTSGTVPQTGDCPVRGNDSSVVPQSGRKTSVRSNQSRRSSGGHDNLPQRNPTPRMTPPAQANTADSAAHDSYGDIPPIPTAKQKRSSRSALDQDFSRLDIHDEQSPTTTTRIPAQGPIPPRASSKVQGSGNSNNAGVRTVKQDDVAQPAYYDSPDPKGNYHPNPEKQTSISRKQVATSTNAPSERKLGHRRNQSDSTPLTSASMSWPNGYDTSRENSTAQSPGVLDRSRPIPRGMTEEEVVIRAKNNTYDTEVVEKVAPAVIQETIHKDVHHIREERITRDIHNHEYYHRILPIVDVEVLPPRHFLPVEGGGLVEVSASEVPGRGNNWVIAETTSKIPSDQAAPQGSRQFTAREFPGREGDAIKYRASEGHEVTEQTWVHPPELETGAQLTGQSWPMILGDENPEGAHHKYSTSQSTKRKSPKKGMSAQARPAQRADGLGRET